MNYHIQMPFEDSYLFVTDLEFNPVVYTEEEVCNFVKRYPAVDIRVVSEQEYLEFLKELEEQPCN